MSQRFMATICFLILLTGCAPPAGVYHTVQQGQTLYRISRAYGIDERFLARLNGIEDPTRLRIGQHLFIPGAEEIKRVPIGLSAVSPENSSPPAVGTIAPSSSPKIVKRPKAASTSSPSMGPPPVKPHGRADGKGIFAWPLKGELIRGFGRNANQPCNGVDIGAPEGTPVQAAAAGKVTYSGDGIRGYGNLIIIRHDDSFFTVYAFNQKNLVEAGDFVSQGQRIALSGSPQNGAEPCLHFEIRQGKAPVNPIFFLP